MEAVVFAWITIGFNTVLFLAGLQGVPADLYEAATIDGANRWQRFRSITLPSVSATTFFVVATTPILAMQLFTEAYVLKGLDPGGPNNATLTPSYISTRPGSRTSNSATRPLSPGCSSGRSSSSPSSSTGVSAPMPSGKRRDDDSSEHGSQRARCRLLADRTGTRAFGAEPEPPARTSCSSPSVPSSCSRSSSWSRRPSRPARRSSAIHHSCCPCRLRRRPTRASRCRCIASRSRARWSRWFRSRPGSGRASSTRSLRPRSDGRGAAGGRDRHPRRGRR